MGSVFDLDIHYNGKTGRVRNVDPDRYCYFDLVADVTDSVLSHMPSNEGIAITVHCAIPGSNEKLLLDSDTSVLQMFKLQCSGGLINLYVEVQSNEAGKDVGDDMLNYLLSTDMTQQIPNPMGMGEGKGDGDSEVVVTMGNADDIDLVVLDDMYEGVVMPEVDDMGEDDIDLVVVDRHGEYDGEDENQDELYGFSDEGRDWKANEVGDESDSGGSLSEEEVPIDDIDGALSDYQSGDDLGHHSSSSDSEIYVEENEPKVRAGVDISSIGKEPYTDKEGKLVLERFMVFDDVDSFRAALRDYTIEQGFKLVRDKNEKGRVTCHCAAEKCPWRIHASPVGDSPTYMIKSLTGEHTCSRVRENKEANSVWIAKKLKQSIVENPLMGLDVLQTKLNNRYGIEAHKMQLYRAKKRCLDEIEGNNWLGSLRCKPILTMLEGIRTKLMVRLQMRYQKSVMWNSKVTYNIKKKLDKLENPMRSCSVQYSGGHEYQVYDEGVSYVVHLGGAKNCVCGSWMISGIPCKHAAAAVAYSRLDIQDFVSPYFSKDMYVRGNSGMIHPILDHTMWTTIEGDPLEPPPLRRLPGRPRKNRRREEDEPPAGTSVVKRSHTLKCTNCGYFGHNKRTCQRAPVRGRSNARGTMSVRGRGRNSNRGGSVRGRGRSNVGNSTGAAVRGRSNSRGAGARGRSSNRGAGARGRSNTRGARGRPRGTQMQFDGQESQALVPSQCLTQL